MVAVKSFNKATCKSSTLRHRFDKDIGITLGAHLTLSKFGQVFKIIPPNILWW